MNFYIYKTKIEPSKNMVLDNMEGYLSSLPIASTKSFGIKYVEPGMNVTVKVPLNMIEGSLLRYNYAKLTDEEGHRWYYFITGSTTRARRTVSFTLSMDTLNTFWTDISAAAHLSPETKIIREHQDRYDQDTAVRNAQGNWECLPKIDKFNEGLNPLTDSYISSYEMKSDKEYTANANMTEKWYVIYATRDDISVNNTANPVIKYAVPGKARKRINASQTGPDSLDITLLIPDHKTTYIIDEGYTTNFSIKQGATNQSAAIGYVPENHPDWTLRAIKIKRISLALFQISVLYYTGESYPYSFHHEDIWYTSTDASVPPVVTLSGAALHIYTSSYDSLTSLPVIPTKSTQVNTLVGNIPAVYSATFAGPDAIDNSNSHFIRIVESPYVPAKLTADSYNFSLTGWTFDYGYKMWKQNIGSAPMYSKIEDSLITELSKTTITPDATASRGTVYETKFFSPEFYSLSFVYNNEGFAIPLDRITPSTTGKTYVNIDYYLTNSMNCDKLFKFGYSTDDPEFVSRMPHDNFLYSSRSTERPIQNSSYVDYLRSGYNYDQEATKQANRKAIFDSIVGIAIGSTGTATQIAIQNFGYAEGIKPLLEARNKSLEAANKTYMDAYNAGMTADPIKDPGAALDAYEKFFGLGGTPSAAETRDAAIKKADETYRSAAKPYAVKTGLSAATLATQTAGSIASNVFNAVNTIQSNNRSFAKSLSQAQIAKATMVGTAPTDLMSIQGDKLEVFRYGLTPEVSAPISDLFYYNGYAHPVKGIPEFSSRYWFNYVMCEPQFINVEDQPWLEYVDDIKARFGLGITVYHRHNNTYDFEQTHENFESWMMED